MENCKSERESNGEPTLKISLDKDMTCEAGQSAVETNPVPSTSVTSRGITSTSTISTSRQERIEFNVQECIPTFFGREEFIKKLHENISNIRTPNSSSIRSKAIVICGLGGVGKTQVVRRYIQEYKEYYGHVLWINAESYNGATSNFLQLAKKLRINANLDGTQNTDQNIMEKVYDFVCKKFALLIYDNMDSSPNIFRLLPQAVKTTWKVPVIIITSRNRAWLNFKVEELAVFNLSESLSFLSLLEFTNFEVNRFLCQEVVTICQGLPLALQQVVTFVRSKQKHRAAVDKEPYSLKDFLVDIAIQRKKFLKTRPEGVQYPDLFTLYDMTFEHILYTKHGILALQCLDVMAIHNPDHISTELIQKTLHRAADQLAKALNLLCNLSLITRCEGYYQMHRMIQAAINESRNTGSKFTYMKDNFYQIIDSVCEFIEELHTNSMNVHQKLDNVIRIHDLHPEINTKQFLKFQINLAKKLKDVGNYRIAIKICLKTVASSKQLYGADHPITLNTKHTLAEDFQAQGKYDDALELYNDILELRNKILGPDHPSTLTTKNNLASVFQAQGKYDYALELYNNVLELSNKILGPNHPSTLTTKNNLASVFQAQGKYDVAIELYHEVLEIRNKIFFPDHPSTLTTKNNLAGVFQAQGKYDDALELYKEVLLIRNKFLGPEHPSTIMTKNDLAAMFQAQGKYDDALELYNHVLEISNAIFGPEYPETLTIKNNLAGVFQSQGKYDNAAELLNEVLRMKNTVLGPNHPDTLTTKNNLAAVFQAQGKYDDALELYNHVLENRNKILGPEHPNTLTTKNDLALVLKTQGKYDDAIEVYSSILQTSNKILFPDHPHTLTFKNNLASVFRAQGKYDDAVELYTDVLETSNKILGPEHPDTLMLKNSLAAVFQAQGKYDDALELYKEVLEVSNKILGPEHLSTLTTKNSLAAVLQALGR